MYVFNGPEYDPGRDNDRLVSQIARVYVVMSDGVWRTCAEVAALTTSLRQFGQDPENSVQAQWRHLRKARWGGHTVERRSRSGSLFEYRLIPSGRGLLSGRPRSPRSKRPPFPTDMVIHRDQHPQPERAV